MYIYLRFHIVDQVQDLVLDILIKTPSRVGDSPNIGFRDTALPMDITNELFVKNQPNTKIVNVNVPP